VKIDQLGEWKPLQTAMGELKQSERK
jgi:hypothetical protein